MNKRKFVCRVSVASEPWVLEQPRKFVEWVEAPPKIDLEIRIVLIARLENH